MSASAPYASSSPSTRSAGFLLGLFSIAAPGWLAASEEPRAVEGARRLGASGEPPAVTAALVQGQVIVGQVLDEVLSIRTKYGELRVPFSEVIRIRLRPTLSPEEDARLETLLEVLRRTEIEQEVLERTIAELAGFGLGAYETLERAAEEMKDEAAARELRTAIAELLESCRKDENFYMDDLDEVVTERFTIRGEVLAEEIGFHTLSRTLRVPRSDILGLSFRELEERKTWKVGPEHLERSGFLETQLKVKKGQRISLEVSGTMTYNGQSFGPEGLSNHHWNSRRVGCLQWRIGGAGGWEVLGSKFEGRAPASGTLQFSVHIPGGNAGGQFIVKFKSRRK
jgi:hypothetical protein